MSIEKYANAFGSRGPNWTHLTAPMLVGDLTAHVALAAPTELQGGQFRVSIQLDHAHPDNGELLLVTAAAATTTWTVTRGIEGTVAAAHASGSTVAHVLTAASLTDITSGGAPTTPDYLVGTAQAGLSAEIVVGTTPGGELGGTWASPTVDATHSGSTHAAAQAAAESTTAEALSSHAGAADPHTGYQKESEKGAASGYAGLGAGGVVPIAQLASGTPDGTKYVRDDGTLVGLAADTNFAALVARITVLEGGQMTDPPPAESYAATCAADSPSSAWRLGEATPGTGTAVDDQGAHAGTYSGSPVSTAGALTGDADTAVDFTGTVPARFVNMAGYTTMPSVFSIEAWINAAVFDDMAVAGWWSSGTVAAFLYLNSADNVSFRVGADSTCAWDSNSALQTGWHHLVGTYDGTQSRLYADGALVAGPVTTTFAGGASTYPFQIGNYGDAYTANFAGKIDEVRVYPTALTLAQVVVHHAAGQAASGRPFAAPVTTQAVTVSAGLSAAALNSLIAGTSDGTVFNFPAGSSYSLASAILFSNRHNLVFDGHGATLTNTGNGLQENSLFRVMGGNTNIAIRNFNLVGNSPYPGVYQSDGNEYAYGVEVLGSNVEISNVTISAVYGDGVMTDNPANGVWFHDSHVVSAGRNGIAVLGGNNITAERVAFDTSGWATLDIEPWQASGVATNIKFLNNTAGTWNGPLWGFFFGASGVDGATVNNVIVSGNTITGSPLTATVTTLPRRQNIVFTNNRSTAAAVAGPVLTFAHVDGLTVTGNTQPLSSGSLCSITDCTSAVTSPNP